MTSQPKTIKIKIVNNKKKFGQFYTTNYKYILQDLYIPDNIENIIEPFCGNADLLKFASVDLKIECFDIEPKKQFIKKQDTILNPPDYVNKFVLTNPPYLARNKSNDKTLFDKYKTNDLYKCFILSILDVNNTASGGILIVPLNFFSSIRKSDILLRKKFLDVYDILHINIFEEKVFEDTSYTICSFQFCKKINNEINNEINIVVYPSKKNIKTFLSSDNNYTIGGEIYNLKKQKKYKIVRATKENKNNIGITNLLIKCIDDSNKNKISLSFIENDEKRYIDNTPKKSARSYATLIINPPITKENQKLLIVKFNDFINEKRLIYHSLFLTNYRESKDIARKRISFDLVYNILHHLLT
jgi:hypothetical protein